MGFDAGDLFDDFCRERGIYGRRAQFRRYLAESVYDAETPPWDEAELAAMLPLFRAHEQRLAQAMAQAQGGE